MKKSLFLGFAVLLSLAFLIPFIYAQMGIPEQFWGTVTYNSAPAPNGVSVIAKIDGAIVKETTTVDGKYGYDPLFMITDPNEARAGKTIIFYVNNVEAANAVFENGGTTELNLAASGPAINPPPAPSGGGSTNGGGGGGRNIITAEPINTQTSGGSGAGGGGSSNEEETTGNTPTAGRGITGAVIGALGTGGTILAALFILIIMAGAVIVIYRKKKSP